MIDAIRRHPGSRVALIEPQSGRTVSYSELSGLVDAAAGRLRSAAKGRGLVFLAMSPDIDAVVLYLACLEARLPVCLAELQPLPLARLAAAYTPRLMLLPQALEAPPGYRSDAPSAGGLSYTVWRRVDDAAAELHPDLALLLTTSGSTGSPKLVRLAERNLLANATAISEYLEITPDERAIQSLPGHYSYGLSVLNSHLVAGASVVLTPHSFMRPEFWKVLDEFHCTSFAGVPYMYETLHRLRFTPVRHPSLRTLTQAGGALRPDLIAHFLELAAPSERRLYIMYGQTEATARISYVPRPRLADKLGSIGIPIPNGKLSLAPVEGGEGLEELVYEGPNVMLGYAESLADLALGDVQRGVLRTGDLGRADEDGFFFVLGRLRRFAKLFGRRVSLEDIERELESRFAVRVAATGGEDCVVLHVVMDRPEAPETLSGHVARYLGVPPKAVSVKVVESLPLTSAGKKDYKALEGRHA